MFGREPETADERAYVLRLARQELEEARDMERSTGRFVLTGLAGGLALFLVLTGAASLIGLMTGALAAIGTPGGPIATAAVCGVAFGSFQVIRAPFRARKRRRRAREAAELPMQALVELADVDDELNL
jgi:hypothetical protein